MNLERLAANVRGHRYLPRSVGPGAAALAVVPALADGLALPVDREASIPAHALDAMAPATERMLSSLIADLDANVSDSGDRNHEDDPFVSALRDTILAGAAISDAAGALAVLQAARTCSDALAQPPVRLLPLVTRFQEGTPDVRGPALAGLVRGIQSRVAEACAGAARSGWRMPAFASDLLGCRLAWLFGRGSLDVDPQLPVVAAILGVTVPTTLIAAADRAVRLVVGDVIARRAARKSRPEDQLLLLRWLTPDLIALGADTCGRLAACDPDLVSAVLPQLAIFADAKALAKAGIERSIADQLVRPEAGVAAASALAEIGTELRRWDVHSCLAAALVRVDARAPLPVQAFGPRRRVLQGAVVAAISRPGAPPEGILRASPPPDTALVTEHGSFALVAFADPVEAVRWALGLVSAQGDLLSVGVGAGRVNGGTDGSTTTLQGPAVQGALAAVRRGALGLSAAAAEELVEACPSPDRGGAPDGGLSCLLDGRPLRLDVVAGMTGVFQVELAAAISPPPRPTRLTPEVEVMPEPAPPPRPMPDLLAPRGASSEVTGPQVIPAPLRRPAPAGFEPVARPVAVVAPRVAPPPAVPDENPFDDNTPTPPPTRLASLSGAPPAGDPFAMDAPASSAPSGDDTFWDETPTRVQPPVQELSPAVLAATSIEIPPVPEFVAPASLMEPIERVRVAAAPDLSEDAAATFALPVRTTPGVAAEDDGPVDWEAPTAAEMKSIDATEDTNDFGTFDFNFDFEESENAGTLEMGGRRVAAVEPLAALGERTEDDATHIERVRTDDEEEELLVPSSAEGFSFDLEVEETDDEVSGLPIPPPEPAEDREIHDGSFQFPFEMVDELSVPAAAAEDGFAMGLDNGAEAAEFRPATTGPDAELTDVGFHFPETEVGHPAADGDGALDFDFGFPAAEDPSPPPVVVPAPPRAAPVAPVAEPASPPVSRRKASVAVDFDHLFRGYCFYLDDLNAVFGRPYGGRMVDRHQYPYTGDIEQVYRSFLQDKIREGFVPQTDLTGDVPATMTLLPLNSERLQRAWGVLT